MKVNKKGQNLIVYFEGEKLAPYKCSAGVWTIGVGHTGSLEAIGIDKPIEKVKSITQAQSRKLLAQDLEYFEKAVESAVKVPLTQDQFNALVSFTFNCGTGALKQSTLLKRVNLRDTPENIMSAFKMWCNANGKPVHGLIKRRVEEAQVFNGQGYPNAVEVM